MAMNGIEIALMICRIDKDYHLIVWKLPYAQKFSGSGKVHSSAQGRQLERDYKRHGHLSPANDPFVHVLWATSIQVVNVVHFIGPPTRTHNK